jgi:uncharacterized protein (TIGR03067 family)
MKRHALKVLVMSLAVGFFGGRATAEAPSEAAVKKELKKLQGTWRFVTIEDAQSASRSAAAREKANQLLAKMKLVMVIKGNTMITRIGNLKASEGTFKLYPGKNPRGMDVTQAKGQHKGTGKGIYTLSGDTLKVYFAAVGEGRPKELKITRTSKGALITFQREKP